MGDINTEQKIIDTNSGLDNGQNKCPKCGATDISLNTKNGHLRCNFCRHEFEPEKIEELNIDVSQLEGEVITSGAKDIEADVEDLVTIKCQSCGAEVVINTLEATQARCHWCRNTLSINQQIPNGSVPDEVLPFSLTKKDAKSLIEQFVGKRKFFANPKFKAEFTTDNIMGVYFPYMLVDVNSHALFVGQGEHQTRRYTVGSGDNKKTRYDADLYDVEREFDLTVEGLTVESSADKLNKNATDKTNNIINAIMPFDTENCVRWNANYLKGYSSEKRDVNIDDLRKVVDEQSKDIARFAANESLSHYDRGVRWDTETLTVKGRQWKSAHLPVWLYSYQEIKGNKKILHYVAVNARTKETIGSVPIHMPKLIGVSALVEALGFGGTLMVDFDGEEFLLASGIAFFLVMYLRYRNSNARHYHEKETKKKISGIRKVDNFIKKLKGLSNSRIDGANNEKVSNQNAGEQFLNAIRK